MIGSAASRRCAIAKIAVFEGCQAYRGHLPDVGNGAGNYKREEFVTTS